MADMAPVPTRGKFRSGRANNFDFEAVRDWVFPNRSNRSGQIRAGKRIAFSRATHGGNDRPIDTHHESARRRDSAEAMKETKMSAIQTTAIVHWLPIVCGE